MREIKLTKGKVTLVDDEDYDRLTHFKWNCDEGYAKRMTYKHGEKRKHITIGHEILGVNPGREVIIDHINRDRLDNRKENLRICNYQKNSLNRPHKNRFRGVNWNQKSGKWQTEIKSGKQRIFLGMFDCELEAAKAYDQAAQKYHGEFAILNEAIK